LNRLPGLIGGPIARPPPPQIPTPTHSCSAVLVGDTSLASQSFGYEDILFLFCAEWWFYAD
jgi:hypothetical protein